MSRTSVLVAVISILSSSAISAQTPARLGQCVGNQDTCNVLLGQDSAAAGAPGGIGSKKGTGGAGTSAIRPDGSSNPPVTLPSAPKLPSIPRRFGF